MLVLINALAKLVLILEDDSLVFGVFAGGRGGGLLLDEGSHDVIVAFLLRIQFPDCLQHFISIGNIFISVLV